MSRTHHLCVLFDLYDNGEPYEGGPDALMEQLDEDTVAEHIDAILGCIQYAALRLGIVQPELTILPDAYPDDARLSLAILFNGIYHPQMRHYHPDMACKKALHAQESLVRSVQEILRTHRLPVE